MKKILLTALAASTLMGTVASAGTFQVKNNSANHIEILIRYENQSTVYNETAAFGSGFGDESRYRPFNFGSNTAYVSVRPVAGGIFGFTDYKIGPEDHLRVDYAGAAGQIFKNEYATAGEGAKDQLQYKSGEYNSIDNRLRCGGECGTR